MSLTNLGDLSQSYVMRVRNTALKQDINRLTQELSTGQVADVREVLAGNFSFLTDIERRMSVLDGYNVVTQEARLFGQSIQDALAIVEQFGEDFSASLLAGSSSGIGAAASDRVVEAEITLEGIVGTLNSNAAGRFLFSGIATDRAPLPEAQTILTQLRAAVTAAGATTPADIMTAAAAWFDDPAGFDALVYQGAASLAPIELSELEQVSLDVRAIDPEVKQVLRLTAVAAIADDASFGFGIEQQADLFERAGAQLLIAQDDVIALRAEVGFTQAQIDGIATRNESEKTSLEFARLDLLQADPYEAATELENAQFQLQSLYQVTVRMSQLSLVNFL